MGIMVSYAEVGTEIQNTVLPLSVELSDMLDDANNIRILTKANEAKEVA